MGFTPPSWATQPTASCTLTDPSNPSDIPIQVDQKPFYVIGRSDDPAFANDIVIDNSTISRRHAAIVHHENGRTYIIDLASREGVIVDGHKIEPNKPTHLANGSKFSVGNKTYFVNTASTAAGKPAPQEQDANIQMRCSHLLVKHRGSRRPASWKEPVVTRSQEEALEMIKAFRAHLVASANLAEAFAQLASVESHCGSARAGGDLGWFGRGQMQKAFEEGTLALQVGELSEPIYSDSGVHLILRTG